MYFYITNGLLLIKSVFIQVETNKVVYVEKMSGSSGIGQSSLKTSLSLKTPWRNLGTKLPELFTWQMESTDFFELIH